METTEQALEIVRTEKHAEGREWDRSEWFRMWLELIRQGSPHRAAS